MGILRNATLKVTPPFHNYMLLENILLYILPNTLDKVYIGICNWAMVRNFRELRKLLCIHNDAEKSRTIQNRW
jgi:hypothetical protein